MFKKASVCVVAMAAVLAAPVAGASEAVVKKARCVACHQIEKKAVGPAYKDVANKYRGDAEAVATLSAKVRSGGSGVWGNVPMPPHDAAKISDDDLKSAIEWILALQ